MSPSSRNHIEVLLLLNRLFFSFSEMVPPWRRLLDSFFPVPRSSMPVGDGEYLYRTRCLTVNDSERKPLYYELTRAVFVKRPTLRRLQHAIESAVHTGDELQCGAFIAIQIPNYRRPQFLQGCWMDL